jgi:hypothetical protein
MGAETNSVAGWQFQTKRTPLITNGKRIIGALRLVNTQRGNPVASV